MIKLTGQDGTPIYLSPEQIASTQESGGILTRVYIAGTMADCFLVKEAPEEVVRKIMDYKVKMVHLKSILCPPEPNLELADEFETDLRELAGLAQ
jgi:uncharacterized protein YlzI (FlbEa/FlbD family)